MKLGIMQPYFIPYIGYWQLMNAVDKYVVYDDVNFIKGGWINRNRLLISGEPKYFNIPLLGASSNKLINEIKVNKQCVLTEKNLRIIQNEYKYAPYFEEVYSLMQEMLYCEESVLSKYILESFRIICRYLDIRTELVLSSDLNKDVTLKGQDKVIHICEVLNATEYYNAIGGQELYSKKAFEDSDMQLKFLKSDDIIYKQFDEKFYENLSIIDVMMFNSKEVVKSMLEQYSLL